MSLVPLTELIPVLQMAVGPVILISGVGLLLLSMTNRLGRVIDRARILCQDLREDKVRDPRGHLTQLRILARRAKLIRLAITLASASVLLAAVLVITLFLVALLQADLGWLVTLVFITCLLALIGSLVAFILDLNQSLLALDVDIGEAIDKPAN